MEPDAPSILFIHPYRTAQTRQGCARGAVRSYSSIGYQGYFLCNHVAMEVLDAHGRRGLFRQQLGNLIPRPYPPRRTKFPKFFAEQIEHRVPVPAYRRIEERFFKRAKLFGDSRHIYCTGALRYRSKCARMRLNNSTRASFPEMECVLRGNTWKSYGIPASISA